MKTSTRNPPLNASSYISNFDLRGVTGDLELRDGYDLLYAAFTHTYLTSLTFWEFESLYVPETETEDFIVVGEGTTVARTDTLVFTPFAMLIILSRTAAGWTWINDTIHTGIFSIDPDTVGTWEIELDFTDGDADYDGWTVVNISDTPATFAKVIKTSASGGGRVKLELSSEAHGWIANKELLLMKNYIPYIDLQQIAVNVTGKDVSFHRVLNDLRIGFGGQVDRIGLAVGYRNYHLQVNNCDHNTFSDGEMDTFAEYDGLMVTPHSALTEEAKFDLSAVGGGSLSAGKYYFRMTAVLDDLSEILLNADTAILINDNEDIGYVAKIRLGTENLRITKIKIYFADSDLVYELIHEEVIRDRSLRNKRFNIDIDGYLVLDAVVSEKHDPGETQNAANLDTATDPITTTGWTPSFYTQLTGTADVGAGSINTIKMGRGTALGTLPLFCKYTFAESIIPGVYNISIWMKAFAPTAAEVAFNFRYTTGTLQIGPKTTITIDNTYTEYTFTVETPAWGATQFWIEVIHGTTGNSQDIRFDQLSITGKSFYAVTLTTPERGSEISAEMGYTPDLNQIRSWDKGIVTLGRSFLLGVYIDKRYINKVFFSQISGAAANMYDAYNADPISLYDLENFDGQELIDIEVLSNLDFLGIRSNGNQRIDSQTGRSTDIEYGSGILTRKGAVNMGKHVIYPGENDIIMANGVQSIYASDGSVREAYRALTTGYKAAIIATREEKDNAYRMFSGDTTNKWEYILTKRGWVYAQRSNYPEAYTIARDGNVCFMNTGIIYKDSTNKLDNDGITSLARWHSVDIDADLLGMQVDIDEVMVLQGVYVFYTSSVPLTLYVSINNLAAIHDTLVLPLGDKVRSGRPLKTLANCKAFLLQLTATYTNNADYCSIHSVMFDVDKIKRKRNVQNATS